MTRLMRYNGLNLLPAFIILALAAPVGAQTPEEAAAREVADDWLESLDAGEFATTWREAAVVFQNSIDEDEWVEQASSLRQQVGEIEGREFVASESATDPEGAPPGEYVNVQYRSEFGTAGPAAEVVVLMDEEERGWRVVGYFLQPPSGM